MKRLKKHIGKTIGVTFIIILACAWILKAPIAAWYLSSTMKVPVSMLTFNVWPTQLTIHSFKIKNPPQFAYRRAMEVQSIVVDYDSKKLTGNPIEINQIDLDGVYLRIDITNSSGTENNWTAISQGMQASKEQSANEPPAKGTLIHKLIITNLTVEVQGLYGQPTVSRFEHIELNNLSSQSGFPTASLIQGIFQQSGLEQFIPGLIKDVIGPFFGG